MSFLAHRHGDARICGASTVVVGQNNVKVNGRLWAVRGDPNSHENGALTNSTGSSVKINGIPIIVHGPDHAVPDAICPLVGDPHCDPMTAGGSPDVKAY